MILERLEQGVVIGDGGAIFELERRGYVSAGPFTPEVTIQHPEAVRQLQTEFARAGADVLQAVTYYAHEDKLRESGLEGALEAINRAAVTIAKSAAEPYGCLVAGTLSNTWVYRPDDLAAAKETRRQFDEQISYQIDDGVDFFIAETIEYLGEAQIALEAIEAAGRPAMITLGFKYSDLTLDNYPLEEAFKALEALGADIVGLNCFRDPERMLPLAQRLRDAVSVHVAAQPVGYRCTDSRPYFMVQELDGVVAFPLALDPFTLTRAEMADFALKAKQMGIDYIGSCCGAAPHHVRAMAEALGRTPPASAHSPKVELHPVVGDDGRLHGVDERTLCEQRHGVEACREDDD